MNLKGVKYASSQLNQSLINTHFKKSIEIMT